MISAASAAAPWTPASFGADLYAWYDPSLVSLGTGVSGWANQQGTAARDLSQATGTRQPAVDASSFNGRQSIQGDGTDDYLLTGAGVFSLTDFTIYLFFRPIADANQYLIGLYSGADGGIRFNVTTRTAMMFDGATITTGTDAATLNAGNVITCKRTGNTGQIAMNRGSFTSGSFASNPNRLYVLVRGLLATYFSGQMGDIIVLNRASTGAEDTQVYDWGATRWGSP